MGADIRKKKKSRTSGQILLWHIAQRLKDDPDSPQSKRVRRIVELLLELNKNVGVGDVLQGISILRELPIDHYRFKFNIGFNSKVNTGMSAADDDLSQKDLWEYGAVSTLLDFVGKPGGLDRIRRCECGDVFFAARRADKKYCGNVCKQRHYDKDEDVRKRKLAIMRKNYKDANDRRKRVEEKIGYVAPRKKSAKKLR